MKNVDIRFINITNFKRINVSNIPVFDIISGDEFTIKYKIKKLYDN